LRGLLALALGLAAVFFVAAVLGLGAAFFAAGLVAAFCQGISTGPRSVDRIRRAHLGSGRLSRGGLRGRLSSGLLQELDGAGRS
jgi:hypothetical protein